MLLYRLLLSVAAPVLALWMAAAVLRGRVPRDGLAQRLGWVALPDGAIWVHGASNGELTSARPLIEALRSAHPNRPIVVSANTVTGRDLVSRWAIPQVTSHLAPFDLRWCLRTHLRAKPVAYLGIENEIWPNRVTTLARAHVPVALVSARISERSAARWQRMAGLGREIFANLAYLAPQDAASAERFARLGVARDAMGPRLALKASVSLGADPDDMPGFERQNTVLAAATHAGEEEVILDAFARAQAARPALRLILAPRHPRRAPEIEQLARARGLSLARRTRGEMPSANAPIYLADTLGEMAGWYRAASLSFIGGSLVPKGGHTPYEPTAAGSAILTGPHVDNFTDAYQDLFKAEAAQRIKGSAELSTAFQTLPGSATVEAMARRAAETLSGQGDQALDTLVRWVGHQITGP